MPNSYARRTQELQKLLRSESLDGLGGHQPADGYTSRDSTGEAGTLIAQPQALGLW